MARQSTTPVQFQRSTRTDDSVTMTSGRAGKVVPVGFIPLLRGDSLSGRVGIDVDLAEMPRPLLNSVNLNVQAWFIPKVAHPQFSGYDEFMHSYQGEQIKSLGAPDRDPPPFFNNTVEGGTVYKNSEVFKTLGLHVANGDLLNFDLLDAFNLVYNFRLAAHSSRLERLPYSSEIGGANGKLPRAFWPSGSLSGIVPDYERALVVGALDLDVTAGQIPVSGLGIRNSDLPLGAGITGYQSFGVRQSDGSLNTGDYTHVGDSHGGDGISMRYNVAEARPDVFAEMTNQKVGITLADIDKARTTQAFAKLRTAYAGNDATGFDNDDAIVAELMQGFRVPEDQFKRPWLLDSKRVTFGMAERHATDGANLDASVSQGRAMAQMSLNVPSQDVGGVIIFTVEVLPERILEAQSDEWLSLNDVSQLPDALRDVQRPEPVDMVQNRRIDARHANPDALYGYEPMNAVWNRNFTRLGGAFYQTDPLNPFTEQRAAIWQAGVVNPTFTEDHWLAVEDFPHDVFSDTLAPAFEVVCRHTSKIVGITQIGDVLAENNDDYASVENDDA